MMAMTDATYEALQTYRRRRQQLITESKEADASRRPLQAAKLRQAARRLSQAILDEQINEQPTGLERSDG